MDIPEAEYLVFELGSFDYEQANFDFATTERIIYFDFDPERQFNKATMMQSNKRPTQ